MTMEAQNPVMSPMTPPPTAKTMESRPMPSFSIQSRIFSVWLNDLVFSPLGRYMISAFDAPF
jgi:hypothetical protein